MRQNKKIKVNNEPEAEEDLSSYQEEQSEEDFEIPDDGEYTSEHSSIDLQEYLRNRDNIPSEPSDAEDYDQQDDEEGDDKKGKQTAKTNKKERIQQKRQEKDNEKTQNKPENADKQNNEQ